VLEEDDDVRKPVLRDSELLQLIFESATDFAIFTMDPNGVTTSWNTGAEHLLGYKGQEIVGRSADVIFPPEADGHNAAAEERRLALAHGRAEDERSQTRKDGSLFWASGLLMPLADRSVGFVKIVRDRTHRHRTEQQLRDSEDLFRTLAINLPELVFRSRADGYRTWASPQWSIFTGSPFAESEATTRSRARRFSTPCARSSRCRESSLRTRRPRKRPSTGPGKAWTSPTRCIWLARANARSSRASTAAFPAWRRKSGR
jgi:PAS domain S-box-containing protein